MPKSIVTRMATCRQTGKPLPPNLYSDNKGRPNTYRYRREDGTWKVLRLPYARAVAAAKRANAQRGAVEGSLAGWVSEYRRWQIGHDPRLEKKRGWKERQRQLEKFAEQWDHINPRLLTVGTLSDWWDDLTYDQQHNRRSHFSGFFQWALGKGVVRQNPFSARDDVARLKEKAKPDKQRPALDWEAFWLIHEQAEAHIQIAMLISLATAMRAGDVVALRWDDIEDGYLRKTINKSVNQRGATAAAHLMWSLSEHPLLKRAIDEARARMVAKGWRSPYIVTRPRSRAKSLGRGLTDRHQCRTEHLSRGFKEARDKAEQWPADGPTFHEIRGLAISLLLNSGRDIAAVQRLAAHTSAAQTSAYAAGQAPHFMDMAGMVVDVAG